MSIPYTNKERQAINLAWDELIHFADQRVLDGSRELATFLADERRNANSIHAAKALLLGSLANANETEPKLLWHYRGSHRGIVALAWAYWSHLQSDGILASAQRAYDFHHGAFERHLDRI